MATQNIVFLVIFIIFLAFLFISSFVAKNWVKETDDYVLAGRQISTGMNIFGVIAIGFAGTTMALAPGFAIQFGFKGSFLWSAIYSFCGLAFYGLLYSNFVRRCGAQTLPEFLEMRYDGKTRSVIAITSVVGMLGIMANNIVSAITNICAYTGWNKAVVTAVIFAVIIAFTYISGMWAISMTDLVQVIMGIIIVPLVMVLVIKQYGPLSGLAGAWPNGNPMGEGFMGTIPNAGLTYPSVINFVILFASALVWGNNYYWMKIANCRSEKVARKSFVWSAFLLLIIFCVPLGIVGLYAGAFHPEVFTFNGGTVMPTGAYGFIASTLIPLFGSLAVIGAVAASVSTSATSALGASAVMTRDIYQRLIDKSGDPQKRLRASKWILIIVGAVTFILCQFPGGPTYLFAFANCWLVPPSVLLLLGMVWKKFNSTGAFWGALCGMVVMAVFELLELTGVFVVGSYIYLATLGLIVSFVAAIIASLFGKPKYFGASDWELVPNDHNRENITLDATDKEALRLICVGHKYMADITDYMGLDSKVTDAAIEHLDRGGYIQRAGLNMSKLYTFSATDKGRAVIGLSGNDAKLASVGLTPDYVEFLKLVKTGDAHKQNEWIAAKKIRSMQMAAISSHLTREGYIKEKGLMRRKYEITEKGLAAIK